LKKGDRVSFEVRKDGLVVLRKASPMDEEWARSVESTLSEWSAAEDDDAFGIYDRFDVVVVPFPFTDRQATNAGLRLSFQMKSKCRPSSVTLY